MTGGALPVGALLAGALVGIAVLLGRPRRAAHLPVGARAGLGPAGRNPLRARRESARWRSLRVIHRRRDPRAALRTADLADRLAALGRAGVPQGRAWQLLADAGGCGSTECGVVAAMLQAGGSAADGIRRAAAASAARGSLRDRSSGPPGALPGLGDLALAMDVGQRSGAPAATLLERLAASLRSDIDREDQREAALAGPRATARLLTWLPLGGLLLGWSIGADPLRVLLGTVPGRICLLTGAVLWTAGRFWTARLVAAAARAGG